MVVDGEICQKPVLCRMHLDWLGMCGEEAVKK